MSSSGAAACGSMLIHATAIAMNGRAVLIRGPSGAGKSDLALRCLAASPSPLLPAPAALVSDDQVLIEPQGRDLLIASAPASIRGKLEVRGHGILIVEPAEPCPVALVADLVSEGSVERYPLTAATVTLAGICLPSVRIRPFEAASPIKLLLALAGPSIWSR